MSAQGANIKKYTVGSDGWNPDIYEDDELGTWVKYDDHLDVVRRIEQRDRERPLKIELLAKDLRDSYGIPSVTYTLTVERDGLPQEAPVDFEFESVLMDVVGEYIAEYRPLFGDTRITIQINGRNIPK